ncbi:YadA family autotransporter adhesin [Variovorax sp. M-6]|uniref:YadA family autotransporter adhesin n=1 Tax=Variovorax sp. M-6 TaxID=3233041 RepID=UPI003F9849ED
MKINRKKTIVATAAAALLSLGASVASAGTLLCSGPLIDNSGQSSQNEKGYFTGGYTNAVTTNGSGAMGQNPNIGFIKDANSSTKCPVGYTEAGFASTASELQEMVSTLAGGEGNPSAVIYNNGGTPAAPGTVTVADGVNGKDAVNVDQLNAGNSTTLNNANNYTDSKTTEAINIANNYTDSKIGDTYNYVDNKVGETYNYIDEKTKYFKANSTGAGSVVTGTDSLAMGPGAVVSGNNAIAGGVNAEAKGNDSVVFGANAKGLANGATAIGAGAVANNAGDVALGQGSTTAMAIATQSASIDGKDYAFAGTTPTSTVSVGSAGAERTVTNVAAGRLDAQSTDSVNGSQLYSTNQAVTALGASVDTLGANTAQNFGGGSTYDPNTGALTAPAYTVNNVTYNNVGSAIDAIGSTVAGNNTSGKPGASATGKDSVAIGAGSVADRDNTVSFGTPGAERQLANVAPGTEGTDATNLNQVRGMVGSGVQQSQAYTDQQINQLDQKSQKQMSGIGAMAMAAAALQPNARAEGNTSISIGAGSYNGEGAFAAGVNYYASNQILLNAKIGFTSAGPAKVGFGVGATFSF